MGMRRLTVLSGVTLVWLVLQVGAAVRIKANTWPITGFGMFKDAVSERLEPQLAVRTAAGSTAVMRAADFGLTDDEFTRYLHRHVVGSPAQPTRPEARERVTRLVRIWNRTHANDPAVAVRATLRVLPLDSGRPRRTLEVLRWRA
jgi:hypothetical protein